MNNYNSALIARSLSSRKHRKRYGKITMVIYEFDHVFATLPANLNKMDFNNWHSIDPVSLVMAFGGAERVARLQMHLLKIFKNVQLHQQKLQQQKLQQQKLQHQQLQHE